MKNDRLMRLLAVLLLLSACGPAVVADVCGTPTVCGSANAGFRLCTRMAGTEVVYLACTDRNNCESGTAVETFFCVSPSDCEAARNQAVDFCAAQP